MLMPLVEALPTQVGQSVRVLMWERDLVDMWCLDQAGARRSYRGKGSLWHCHRELELTLVTKGEGLLAVGDHLGPFRAPDLVLLGPHLPHVWKPRGATAGIAVQLLVDARGGLAELPEAASLGPLAQRARRGLRVHGSTAERVAAALGTLAGRPALDRLATALAVLATLAHAPTSDLGELSTRPVAVDTGGDAIDRVIAWLMQRYSDDVRLAEAVRRSGRSQATFCRRFLAATGRTFVGYVNALRVQDARRALAETDRSVTDIAFRAGFSSLAQFYDVFRREVRCAPLVYRRRMQRTVPPGTSRERVAPDS